MFGLFSPRCPLDIREKTWVELRMQWLVDRLGFDQVRNVEVITPSEKHFPDAYSGSDQEIERIFVQVCDQMGVPRESVKLALFDGAERSPYAYDNRDTLLGVYEQREKESDRHTVWIERRHTADPMHLVATAAHELAHCILLGDGLLTSSDADHEFITDLLPVVRGLGVFAANATLIEESYQLMRSRWRTVSKAGYLPSRMFGYALAVFTWLRGESKSAWDRYLRGDPYNIYKSGLNYLQKTNDCLCRTPTGLGCETPRTLSARLTSDIPGVCLSALWELRRPDPAKLTNHEWSALVDCLDRRDRILICEAALAIAVTGRSDIHVAGKCVELLTQHGTDTGLLSAAALALGSQQGALESEPNLLETAVDELLRVLDNKSPRVVISSLTALNNIAPKLDDLGLQQILHAFRDGLVKCEEEIVTSAARTLRIVCESPRDEVKASFSPDLELRSRAYAALSAESEDEALNAVRLPTRSSLPVPLAEWRPAHVRQPDFSIDVINPPNPC